jgi:LPPG:FO 2-phospho-L-lactate transferase
MKMLDGKYLALSGGVGGAKLALGLSHSLSPEQLTIVANTADDFEHLGLHISPDLDSVMYALAAVDDPERGWGIAGETWAFLEAIEKLGGETWFRLGDQDIATHVLRSQAMRAGQNLSAATQTLCQQLGITHVLLPMSNDPVRTLVQTMDEGVLPFQHYFVRRQCEPRVTGFEFEGIEMAQPQSDFMRALTDPDLSGIVICPSNPYVSIDPIIRLPGVSSAMIESPASVIAVSPIVAGRALKGPAAKMMSELGQSVSALSIAEHYRDLVDWLVVDHRDSEFCERIEDLGVRTFVTDTVMKSFDDKVSLARQVLQAVEVR